MTDPVESRLAEDFRRLKREDARGAPDFTATLRAARDAAEEPVVVPIHRRTAVRRWTAVAATLAAAFAGILLIDRSDPDRSFETVVTSYSSQAGASNWRAPTDGLLEVPGMELLSTMPSIGGDLGSLDETMESPPDSGRDT